jgi:hypothetical protein
MRPDKLKKISNPTEVRRKFNNASYNGSIAVSNRADKKYAYTSNKTGKTIHFGSTQGDYTFHKDKKRQASFKARNATWRTAPKESAAHLSYHLLW